MQLPHNAELDTVDPISFAAKRKLAMDPFDAHHLQRYLAEGKVDSKPLDLPAEVGPGYIDQD
jgi:hypothetical protein